MGKNVQAVSSAKTAVVVVVQDLHSVMVCVFQHKTAKHTVEDVTNPVQQDNSVQVARVASVVVAIHLISAEMLV